MGTLQDLSEPRACPWEVVSQWTSNKGCRVSWEACGGVRQVSAPLARPPRSSPLAPSCLKELCVMPPAGWGSWACGQQVVASGIQGGRVAGSLPASGLRTDAWGARDVLCWW